MNSCPVDKARVVILGQDPYHDLGQASECGWWWLCASQVLRPSLPSPQAYLRRFLRLGLERAGQACC